LADFFLAGMGSRGLRQGLKNMVQEQVAGFLSEESGSKLGTDDSRPGVQELSTNIRQLIGRQGASR